MRNAQHPGLRNAVRALDAVMLGLTWAAVYALRHEAVDIWRAIGWDLFAAKVLQDELKLTNHLYALPAVLGSWIFGISYVGGYDDLHRTRGNQAIGRALQGAAAGVSILLLGLFTFKQIPLISRSVFIPFTLLSVPAVLFNRWLVVRWLQDRHRRGLNVQNMLIVGTAAKALPLLKTLESNPRWGIRVLGVVHPDDYADSEVSGPSYKVLGRVKDLPRLLEKSPVDQVYVTGQAWDSRQLRAIADTCEEVGVELSMDANFLGMRVGQAHLREFEGSSVLSFSSTPTNVEALALKRLMDVVLSAAALVVLAPILMFIALLVKLDDPKGPILFGQVRSGLYGRTFTMWKFRSMVADAERLKAALEAKNEMDGPVFKITDDPRITRLGRFIRKTSIDELPQFWNVFIGEMSLVGPRPPIPAEVEKYERWQRRRLSMKPGITCIWQVSGRNNVDFKTWMQQDLQYIDNWSLLLDVKLLLKTVPVVLLGVGAK
ncbi:MAG: sugar transferase [Deltaproteobacteria bacterium]|nr:sugar transferase [Deltaproteobacteria bacterium]